MAVFILGMHRSGTSAIARLVNLLGPRLSRENDLMQGRPDNPRGHWESLSLYKVNESLLMALGGCWCLPPRPPEGWWQLPGVVQAYAGARQVFEHAYEGVQQWVWKDPRNCLTLPFWQAALNCRPVIVFIHRNPLEVHASLENRNGFSREVAVDLWDIYNRQALLHSRGWPLFALAYERLLEAPEGVLTHLARFLHGQGVLSSAASPDAQTVEQFLSSELRHTRFTPVDVAGSSLLPEQKALFEYLCSLPEQTDSFVPPPLPEPSAVTTLSGLRSAVGPVLSQLKNNLDAAVAQLTQARQQLQEMQTNLTQRS